MANKQTKNKLMEKGNLFADVSADLRQERLEQIAYSQNNEPVRRPYSEETKDETKEFIVSESTTIMEQTAEFKRIQKEFNDAIKKNKEALKDALVTLKRGYSENEETVYLIDDQEEGMMNIYDRFGELLYSRKLRPEEKQSRILTISGTHN